jgi:hypothetical protein
MFDSPGDWAGRRLDVISWEGDLATVAAALERVGGVKVKHGLAMPVWVRRLFLRELHYMCLMFEEGNPPGSCDTFKNVVPDAFSPEDWFRWYNRYSNGEPIVPLVAAVVLVASGTTAEQSGEQSGQSSGGGGGSPGACSAVTVTRADGQQSEQSNGGVEEGKGAE